jgi:hypothetical protein
MRVNEKQICSNCGGECYAVLSDNKISVVSNCCRASIQYHLTGDRQIIFCSYCSRQGDPDKCVFLLAGQRTTADDYCSLGERKQRGMKQYKGYSITSSAIML